MGLRVSKTEHNGAKHGQGAFWGTKLEAKSGSKKIRRQNFKKEIQEQLAPAGGCALDAAEDLRIESSRRGEGA